MHHRQAPLLLLLCSFLFWTKLSLAQTPAYESISTAQGLSQGMVFDILQDKEGFIWVATKGGLNRYDGYGFTVFSNDPYNPHSVSSNTVVKICEDSKGRIWAGTEDAGLNVYDKKSNAFYRIAHNPHDPQSLSGNAIRLMEELPDGRMLIATDGAALNAVQLTDAFFEKAAAPVVTHLTLPGGAQLYGAGTDAAGRFWMGDIDGAVYRFTLGVNGPACVKFPNARLLNNGYLTLDSSLLINAQLLLDDGHNIFPLFDTAKTPIGNLIYRPRQKLWENFHREQNFYDVAKTERGRPLQWNTRLPNNVRIVYPFIIDHSGIVWSGSVGYGLRKYISAGNRFSAQLPHYSVRWIVPDASGSVFLGDFSYGWRRLTKGIIEKEPFNKISPIPQVDNFLIAKNGTYWIKSDSKGYIRYDPLSGALTSYPSFSSHQGIGDKQPLLEDGKGYIWFPGLGGWFNRVNETTGRIDSFSINTNAAKPVLPKAICTALYEDAQGVIWIGTQEGFARLVFDGENTQPKVKWYYNSSASHNSLNYNHVSCFLDDPSEPETYLWICTKGGGLNRFNKKTGDFFHLTTKDGLPHNVVYGIVADAANNIWGSTNNGLFCLMANTVNKNGPPVFRNFTKVYGLQDDEFNTGAYTKLPNGNLAFGGVNGLNVFNPAEILAAGFTPNVFITNILINNAPVAAGDKSGISQTALEAAKGITLSYLQDILSLEFSSLDFTAPAQNKYRYQLVGIDKDWVESGTRRTATYVHLPSGDYVFKVQGSNSQGLWSDKIAELKIKVLPPWWRTWWAYVIYAALVSIAIRTYLGFSVNRARLRAQLKYEKGEAKRAKELDTLKTQLYTNITHEFRTPLTVILGVAQQILNKPGENFTNGMNMIIRNGQSLLKLVNEMLDLSKLDTGNMTLQLVKGDVINFLRYVTESFQSLAEAQKKGLHFLTEIDALPVSYDPEKMRQIVVNLLSNALKFTPEKGNIYITVSMNVLPHDEPNLTLIIKVKDTGIGIPQDQLQNIFDRFYQLDNSHTRTAEGTGIGLSLTKELVKLMEGEIIVKSPPSGANTGSEFTVILPMMKVTAPEELAANPLTNLQTGLVDIAPQKAAFINTKEPQDQSNPLILLVEDNADVAAYIASCLPGYRLRIGKDGKEGIAIATEAIPDLIITDVMMPFVDGFELTRRLKTDEHTSHIPIIMLTAKADAVSKMEGLQRGADAYLNKPFHKEELLLRIAKLLELRKSLQSYYLRKAGIKKAGETIELIPVPIPIEAEDGFVKKVREAIEDHLANTSFTVEDLCKLLFMSHSQLHRKLEALTGCSPNRFIRIIRLNKAKELLKKPAESIGSIALDCGYQDPGYFARVFKQEYGLTPQEWRMTEGVKAGAS